MALKAIYDKQDEIPEGFRELYSEKTGKWELTGIEGIKTQADVDRVQEGLRKEREDHKATKTALEAFSSLKLKPEEITAKLTEMEELRIKAESAGKVDDEKLNQLVEARINSRLKPVEMARDKALKELSEAGERIKTFEAENTRRTIHDAVRSAAKPAGKPGILDDAMDDALMLAERVFEVDSSGKVVVKDQVGFTPGVTPDLWFQEIQGKRPHWWPASEGGGAKGGGGGNLAGGGKNPWSKDGWNFTEQAKYVKAHGTEKAEQMAKMAGSHVGAVVPPK